MASSLRGNARSRLPRLGGILKNWSGQMQPNNNRRLVTRRSTKRTKMMEKWWRSRRRRRRSSIGIRETDREGERDGRGCWRLAVIRRGTQVRGAKDQRISFRGKEDISRLGWKLPVFESRCFKRSWNSRSRWLESFDRCSPGFRRYWFLKRWTVTREARDFDQEIYNIFLQIIKIFSTML